MSREDNYRNFFQLLSVGIEGPRLNEGEKSALRQYPPSGIILFERNVEDADQLRTLVREVRGIIIESSGVAPLIMADHEGGRISVLAAALGVPPTQMAIAAGRNKRRRKDVYRETARLIKSCGINLILSPLADINSEYLNPVIGTRAFGSDCGDVSELVSEAVETYRAEGILTCLKHFPGHGLTDRDSHLTLPVVPITLDKFEEREVVPFVSGIEAGADMVMTAHIRPLDRTLPASMDSAVVKGMLRGKLSFGGVIITDALEMSGASRMAESENKEGGFGKLAEQALSAGNDILLFSRPVCEIVAEMESAFNSGHWEEDFFILGDFRKIHTEAVERVMELRNKIIDFVPKSYVPLSGIDSRGSVSKKEKGALLHYQSPAYLTLAADSVQISTDPRGVLPLSSLSLPSYRFFGEKNDFSGVAVRLYIFRLLRHFKSFIKGSFTAGKREGWRGSFFSVNEDINVLKDLSEEASLLPVEIPVAKGVEEHPPFFELSFNVEGKNKKEVLFLLCRKPVSRDIIAAISVKSDIVVVSDWPYSVNLVSGQKTVILTRGIFPAAATVVNNILYGDNEGL
ncbi:glycoside hydrolase family 3 protein [bacterium]|nr:glycoside hydrolase family 3 protein [bacterium]